jgi:hypothetical protein
MIIEHFTYRRTAMEVANAIQEKLRSNPTLDVEEYQKELSQKVEGAICSTSHSILVSFDNGNKERALVVGYTDSWKIVICEADHDFVSTTITEIKDVSNMNEFLQTHFFNHLPIPAVKIIQKQRNQNETNCQRT